MRTIRRDMLSDAGQLPSPTTLETDVCVIGAGPAGITIARELSAAGREVLLLESGGAKPDAASADLADGGLVGYPYFPLTVARLRAFGGTSHGWPLVEGWRARPLDAVDLEPGRGRDVGWPFGMEELARYYPEAHVRAGLPSDVYEAGVLSPTGDPAFPLPSDDVRTSVFRYSRNDFTDADDVLPSAEGVRVLLRATATKLLRASTGGPVDRVAAIGPHGQHITVRCGVAVLAAGGIDNACLLLASTDTDSSGLGNDMDLVGRHFMERLTLRTGVVVPADAGLVQRLGAYRIHYGVDGAVQGVLTLSADVLRRHGLRNAAFFVEGRSRAASSEGVRSLVTLSHLRDRRPRPRRVVRHLATVARHAGDVATTGWRQLVGGHPDPDVIVLRAQAEPTPLPHSRVTLSRRRDALGRHRVRLDWQIEPADLRSIMKAQELVAAALQAAGIARLEPGDRRAPEPLIEGAHHHLGTTRMHPDPRRGVVDADCRVHGVRNLYVVGSSVFPTAGYANPTLTLIALALRLGRHLRHG